MKSDDEPEDLGALIEANKRPWNSFWTWREKPVGERGAAGEILRQAGIQVVGLSARQDDPPDCEGTLDGIWSAVEVTELVHEKTLARSIKAIRERAAGQEPKKPEAYFVWDRENLLRVIQQLIEAKDAVGYKGGPYQRYVLVIHTDEDFLDSAMVRQLLNGATFRTRLITDVILGLSYEPASRSCPTFRLELTRPCV